MTKELTARLYLRFASIFSGRHDPITVSLMPFGLSCGDGWFQLIWALCEDLERLAAEERTAPPVAVQVKEKFGGLRFYVESATPRMRERIREAEEVSLRTCEECGAEGTRHRVRGWVVTRCPAHMAAG